MSLASRYTILRKITDGGTAEIFLAKQHGAQGFEKTVVLKRIFTTFYADPQFRHMLVDEAHVAMSLNHSNIVQVLDLGEADGRYFLALELCDGWSLDRILKRAKAAGVPIPPALALYVTAEICRALAYAHNKKRPDGKPLGIVHRDVSPHNVLMSEQGEVKLTDFGIAKAQNKTEKSLGNLIKGKVAFMSPEQASAGPLDARSDLFSVGTMLYTMITRRHPFDAPTDYETLMLVKNGDFLPPETARPGLNPELYRVIRKAMGKTPEARYQKAEEMLVDVEQVMRVAFRPVGQTELQRWLADLSSKDGVPTLTREAPPEPPAARSTVGPLRGGSGQESGLVLTLDDAVEVRSADRPPPTPSGTEVMQHPPQFASVDRVWHRKPAVRIAGAAVVLLAGAVVSARALSGRPKSPTTTVATGASPIVAPEAVKVLPTAQPTAQPTQPTAVAAEAQTAPAIASAKADAAGAAGAGGTGSSIAKDEAPPADDEAAAAAAPGAEDEPRHVTKEKAPEKVSEKLPAAQLPVVIKSEPEGSHVSTGRHAFGTTPLTLKLRPGNSYDLTFTRAGYTTVTRHYKFDEHGPQILHVSLKKAPEVHKAPTPATTAPKPAPPPAKKNGFFSR
jgi:eukaryotic-like serine/threonine-protein kinase